MSIFEISRRITEALQLDTTPIGITLVDQIPEGVSSTSIESPSACGFWRQAQTHTFYASAAQHSNCPVGMMVMGFPIPEETNTELGGLVEDMCKSCYLSADEPEKIPTISSKHAGAVYGPLAGRASIPDVALIWVDAQQAMLCNEAMGTAKWGAESPMVTGRPGCGAIPLAIRTDAPVMSLGCAGMRTFTEISTGRFAVVIPGTGLDRFADAVEETARANDHMLEYYQARREEIVAKS